MQTLMLQTKNVFMSGNGFLHVDFYPANIEIADAVMHGAEILLGEMTSQEAIEAYTPIAKEELLKYLNDKFPATYI